ncbi:coenzyme F420-0:L-glutamate ligase [Suipraeoptans intestinalis]|uniref:coenzyme F420-0:L-glutamate ligase n=1 Tax=Suipraeoptans intestinalis TaxID=2606628 RepID=UPI002A7619A9|nr:coenzyme F420-0:L-glutamate ligase [Suipraeoptans intestinalis]MDY3121362.1 coenzyme F420-0:L-glutamate ligase [Suipraeoptans intestinalis]
MEQQTEQIRRIGTISMGLRAPIVQEGDPLQDIVVNTVLEAAASGAFQVEDRDILAVTESILARSQSNYATISQIGADVKAKLGGDTIGVIFPILSRNRFSICLKGFARGARKIVLMLSYPSDEVGNHLVDIDLIDEKRIDPYTDTLTQEEFESLFGKSCHTFTQMDYVTYYKELIQAEGCEAEIIFSNNPRAILDFTDTVLTCDIHTRFRTKRLLKKAGARLVLGMDDILNASVDGSGFHPEYGLLGSNKSTEETIKLFPVDCDAFVKNVQKQLLQKTGKQVEVMIYGDGAFKDPVGKIWELADPVVSPGYTDGLLGTPNEVKLKYLADNEFKHLTGDALKEAVRRSISEKQEHLGNHMAAQGTTPRRLTDLIGSLCDLTSGSGDKGTPFVYIKGYFDNYTV